MKAREVKKLKPDGPLTDNMRRVIGVRVDELYSFVPRALNPDEVEAAHDMRIAAKRLRYLLELSAPIFGAGAGRAAKQVKGLQDVLGEVHDADELMEVANARGLAALAADTAARRVDLHESFTREWRSLQEHDFRGRLEAALRADPPREQR